MKEIKWNVRDKLASFLLLKPRGERYYKITLIAVLTRIDLLYVYISTSSISHYTYICISYNTRYRTDIEFLQHDYHT